MPEWSLVEWLDAGTTPLLALMALMLWRLDRRVYRLELLVKLLEGESA